MTEYQGQPQFVVANFWRDALEPWTELVPGDEWGEYVRALWQAADRGLSTGEEERVLTMLEWVRDELEQALTTDGPGQLSEDRELTQAIRKARLGLPGIITAHRDEAPSFKGEGALEDAISTIPVWMQPTPDDDMAPALEDDPQYATYLRLKAEYEP